MYRYINFERGLTNRELVGDGLLILEGDGDKVYIKGELVPFEEAVKHCNELGHRAMVIDDLQRILREDV